MKMAVLCTVLVIAVVAWASKAGSQLPETSPTLSLAGDWKYLPYDGPAALGDRDAADAGWPTMRIPSNWFLKGKTEYPVAIDLFPVSRGAIVNPGDLGEAGPERGLDYSGSVWFRRHFMYTPAGGPEILRFDMVDYFADVYVNGHLAGRHEGSFQPISFEVSRWLVAGDNVVAVKVGAPAQVIDWTEEYAASWPRRQTQVKGIFGYHDTRPGGTSGRGQERGTGGILGDVTLRASSGVDLVRAEVAPLDVSAQRATLRIDYVLHNWTSGERSATLTGEIAPKNFTSARRDRFTQAVTLAPGENRVRVTRRVDQPALWWSWDYGTPNLYQLTSALSGSRTGAQQTTFGIRSIRRDDNWVWYLNGRRIFPRGSNYISTQWLSQADRAWYERDVALMLEANLNSIRVHAHLERPEFYDVADERGLMVWQDFPLQWGYSDLPTFHAEAARQLPEMIELFFNHPSIIVWSMHNEAPHAMAWMKRKVQDQNLALDEALLAEATRRDPTRVMHRDSGTGDGHPYPGWYGGKVADYATLPGAPFITEYGAQALPIPETLKTMLPAQALWPISAAADDWAFHNFQHDATFNTAKVPLGRTLDEFTWNSQNYQAALLRFATEGYRRAKWTKVTGLYQFMFVDDWPSVTWSVVDYYRRPKRGYTTLAQAMQPTLPSIDTFVVLCGDAIIDLDLTAALAFHRERKALATIVLKDLPRAQVGSYGVVQTARDGRILGFQEKPSPEDAVSTTVNTGIYFFEPAIFDHIPRDMRFDIGGDLFPLLAAQALPFYGVVLPFSWIDIGNTPDYWQATQMILRGEFKIDMPGRELAPGVWGGINLDVDPAADIRGPVYIGSSTSIKAGATVIGPTVIGRNCLIEAGARIDACVVGDYTRVSGFAEVHEKIVSGHFCVDRLGRNVELADTGYGFIVDDVRERRLWSDDDRVLMEFLTAENAPQI